MDNLLFNNQLAAQCEDIVPEAESNNLMTTDDTSLSPVPNNLGGLLQSLGIGHNPVIVIINAPLDAVQTHQPIQVNNYVNANASNDVENALDVDAENQGQLENQSANVVAPLQEIDHVQHPGGNRGWLVGLGIVAGGILGAFLRGLLATPEVSNKAHQRRHPQPTERKFRLALGSLEMDQK
jgi:hypothetical protein